LEFNVPFQHKYGYNRDERVWLISGLILWEKSAFDLRHIIGLYALTALYTVTITALRTRVDILNSLVPGSDYEVKDKGAKTGQRGTPAALLERIYSQCRDVSSRR